MPDSSTSFSAGAADPMTPHGAARSGEGYASGAGGGSCAIGALSIDATEEGVSSPDLLDV
jgi:outer membrane usher protein FimD/PapC